MLKGKFDNRAFSEKIKAIVEPLCNAEQIEFVHAERLSDRGRTIIRIYLDKTNGITIDDCVFMTKQIGDILDIHLEDIDHYNLEISSPGPNRPLTKIEDFERFKGNRVSIETVDPLNGRKRFKGLLEDVENGNIVMIIDQQQVKIEYKKISKAKLSATHGE